MGSGCIERQGGSQAKTKKFLKDQSNKSFDKKES
jgi:hypothetical protein